MHCSNILSVTLFLAAAHYTHARPQEQDPPAPEPTPCLTTIYIGNLERDLTATELVATPVSDSRIIEVRGLSMYASGVTRAVLSTATLLPNVPAVPIVPDHPMALNGTSGNIILDGNEWTFAAENPCPRFISAFTTPDAVAVGEPLPTETSNGVAPPSGNGPEVRRRFQA